MPGVVQDDELPVGAQLAHPLDRGRGDETICLPLDHQRRGLDGTDHVGEDRWPGIETGDRIGGPRRGDRGPGQSLSDRGHVTRRLDDMHRDPARFVGDHPQRLAGQLRRGVGAYEPSTVCLPEDRCCLDGESDRRRPVDAGVGKTGRRGRRDQHQPLHQVRSGGGDHLGDQTACRIADQGVTLLFQGLQVGDDRIAMGLHPIVLAGRAEPEAGQVHGPDPSPLRERLSDRVPVGG